jgi:hypothetical protein
MSRSEMDANANRGSRLPLTVETETTVKAGALTRRRLSLKDHK